MLQVAKQHYICYFSSSRETSLYRLFALPTTALAVSPPSSPVGVWISKWARIPFRFHGIYPRVASDRLYYQVNWGVRGISSISYIDGELHDPVLFVAPLQIQCMESHYDLPYLYLLCKNPKSAQQILIQLSCSKGVWARKDLRLARTGFSTLIVRPEFVLILSDTKGELLLVLHDLSLSLRRCAPLQCLSSAVGCADNILIAPGQHKLDFLPLFHPQTIRVDLEQPSNTGYKRIHSSGGTIYRYCLKGLQCHHQGDHKEQIVLPFPL
jgi:hypothetical protein